MVSQPTTRRNTLPRAFGGLFIIFFLWFSCFFTTLSIFSFSSGATIESLSSCISASISACDTTSPPPVTAVSSITCHRCPRHCQSSFIYVGHDVGRRFFCYLVAALAADDWHGIVFVACCRSLFHNPVTAALGIVSRQSHVGDIGRRLFLLFAALAADDCHGIVFVAALAADDWHGIAFVECSFYST